MRTMNNENNDSVGSQLNRQLEGWLAKAELEYGPARAIIAP